MNKELFEKKIKESGLKKVFLAEKCGMTPQSFMAKVNGEQPPFTIEQVEILQYHLRLDFKELKEIFFDKMVN